MYKMILNKIKSKIALKIAPTIRKICGIKEINNKLDSIYYIINHSIDINNFPKATGSLRDVQLGDVELLRVFNDLCRKYKLQYWLDWGTLLGAVRHKGFIPWDDDLDVSMPRNDFNNLKNN